VISTPYMRGKSELVRRVDGAKRLVSYLSPRIEFWQGQTPIWVHCLKERKDFKVGSRIGDMAPI
jgi:hypothetical protein